MLCLTWGLTTATLAVALYESHMCKLLWPRGVVPTANQCLHLAKVVLGGVVASYVHDSE